jgi:hypothetical protein
MNGAGAYRVEAKAAETPWNPLSALQGGEAHCGAMGGEMGVGERSGIPHLAPTLSAPRGGEGARRG